MVATHDDGMEKPDGAAETVTFGAREAAFPVE